MSNDQVIGILLFLGAIAILVIYGWMIYANLWWWAFFIIISIITIGVIGVVAWIGYTMATTPPPKPIDFRDDKLITEEE